MVLFNIPVLTMTLKVEQHLTLPHLQMLMMMLQSSSIKEQLALILQWLMLLKAWRPEMWLILQVIMQYLVQLHNQVEQLLVLQHQILLKLKFILVSVLMKLTSNHLIGLNRKLIRWLVVILYRKPEIQLNL